MASSTNEKNQHAVEGKNKPVKSELKDLNSGIPRTSKVMSNTFNRMQIKKLIVIPHIPNLGSHYIYWYWK
jgi:hypothetical protein